MTGPAITPEQLHYVDAGELLALMAGTLALRVRTSEDVELLDAIGREFRARNEPGDPDTDAWCARCELPFEIHDDFDGSCPDDVEPRAYAVTPYIFGQEESAA